MDAELRFLEESDDLVCELGLRGREARRRAGAKTLAYVPLDHRSADGPEHLKALPVGTGACLHGLELVGRHSHELELPRPIGKANPSRQGEGHAGAPLRRNAPARGAHEEVHDPRYIRAALSAILPGRRQGQTVASLISASRASIASSSRASARLGASS